MDTRPELPKTPLARRREILRRLRAAGYPTVAAFATSLGRAQSSVSMVLAGRYKSRYIAEAICANAGIDHPADLWPKLYHRDDELPKAS